MSCPECAADSDGLCAFHAGVKADAACGNCAGLKELLTRAAHELEGYLGHKGHSNIDALLEEIEEALTDG